MNPEMVKLLRNNNFTVYLRGQMLGQLYFICSARIIKVLKT